MYDLRQLRHFTALINHGNFARAALALHLSQPALSRSIQALEANLGCVLVNRHSRSISLTAQGQMVFQHAKRLLSASKALEQAVKQIDNLEAGQLRIGAGPFPAAGLVPHALARLVNAYPKLEVEIIVGDWESLRQGMLDEEIEMFVADVRELMTDPLLQVTTLPVQPAVAICRPGHPLLECDDLNFDSIAAYPLAGTHLPEPVARSIMRDTGRDNALSIQCDNFTLLITLVVHSDAICMVPRDVVAEALSQGQLCELPSLSGKIRHHSAYGLVSRLGHRLSPAAEALHNLICT